MDRPRLNKRSISAVVDEVSIDLEIDKLNRIKELLLQFNATKEDHATLSNMFKTNNTDVRAISGFSVTVNFSIKHATVSYSTSPEDLKSLKLIISHILAHYEQKIVDINTEINVIKASLKLELIPRPFNVQ